MVNGYHFFVHPWKNMHMNYFVILSMCQSNLMGFYKLVYFILFICEHFMYPESRVVTMFINNCQRISLHFSSCSY